MRVTVIQMNPGQDKEANILEAGALIAAAAEADRPDIVCLPEMWTCLGGDRPQKMSQSETLPRRGGEGGAAYEFLRREARTRGIVVHGGSMGERDGDRLYNTTVAFGRDGLELARYRKIHLFDITTPQGAVYGESEIYGAGDRVDTYDAGGVRVGCAICYDIRFPELFLALRRGGAELIFLPSAFTVETGKDHWETLVRARAIETQCWIAASATWGRHEDAKGGPRFTFGHSLICDPWGHVVARASDGPGFATARLDPKLTARVRADMPLLAQRKLA